MKPVQKAVSKPKLLNKKQSKPLVENRKRAQGVGITVPSPSISFKTLSRSKINKSE